MSNRKKRTDVEPTAPSNGEGSAEIPVATAVETPLGDAAEPPPVAQPVNGNGTHEAAPANGDKRKPVVSWRFPTDGTTNVQVALWPGTIRLKNGEEVEVFNLTIQRSYLDTRTNEWVNGSKSFRMHDIPVLIHALQKAHGFALDQREQSCPI